MSSAQRAVSVKALTGLVAQQSFTLAFADLSLIVAAVTALSLALVPLMRRDTLQRG